MNAARYIGNRTFTIDACEPQKPAAGEVRLKVAYCGVCGTDLHVFHGDMDRRVRMPQVIGHEMSGTVEELGEAVTGLQPGDPVVVRPLDNRGETEADRGFSHICRDLKFMGIDSPGALQASWTVPAFTIHKLPPGIDLKLAALTEPLAVACHDVRMAAAPSACSLPWLRAKRGRASCFLKSATSASSSRVGLALKQWTRALRTCPR